MATMALLARALYLTTNAVTQVFDLRLSLPPLIWPACLAEAATLAQ